VPRVGGGSAWPAESRYCCLSALPLPSWWPSCWCAGAAAELSVAAGEVELSVAVAHHVLDELPQKMVKLPV
jgi:hypothetical protein